MENEHPKRRGSAQTTSKYCSSRHSSSGQSQHESRSLREEMDHYRASCAYERYKRTCNELEEEQRSLHQTSKSRSCSSKRDSSKKCRCSQFMESKNSRIETKPREPKDDFRSRTTKLLDSFMEEWSQILNSYREQLNQVSTNGTKSNIPSSPPVIDEASMVTKELKNSDEMSDKKEEKSKSALILSKDVRVYCFPYELTFALFSVSDFMQVKRGKIELIMACSISKSIGEYQTFHRVCILSVVSLCYPLMVNSNHESDLPVRRNNEASNGVFALPSCAMLSYHVATSVPSDDQTNEVHCVQDVLHYSSCLMEDPRRCDVAVNDPYILPCIMDPKLHVLSSWVLVFGQILHLFVISALDADIVSN